MEIGTANQLRFKWRENTDRSPEKILEQITP